MLLNQNKSKLERNMATNDLIEIFPNVVEFIFSSRQKIVVYW